VQNRVIAARATVTYTCELSLNGAHMDLYWFVLIISLMCYVAIMNLSFTLKTYSDMIYLLTAVGLSPGGSSTVHIYTQTIHRTTQITTNLEECGLCPVFVSFTLAFALQLMKKHGKTDRVRKTSVRIR
jgi:hypothetical protein